MKQIENNKNINIFKKIFIKLCRIIGFEIIDQSNFTVPTQKKELSDNLSVPGQKSITIPLVEIQIKNKDIRISTFDSFFVEILSQFHLDKDIEKNFETNTDSNTKKIIDDVERKIFCKEYIESIRR